MNNIRKSYRAGFKKDGFTLIEVIITIVLLGIIMIPLAIMSIEYMQGIVYSRKLGIVEGLAKTEMAKINRLSYIDATLADGYDNTAANYEGYPYDLRRTVNYVSGWNNNLKKVQVRLYPQGDAINHLVKVITYIADVAFGAGSSGAAAGSGGGQSDSLIISAGVVSANRLHQIDMRNSSTTDAITISQATVSWINANPAKPAALTQIEMNSVIRWSGTQSTSGATTTLTTPFALSANTTYTNTGIFTFSQNIQSVTIIFIMSDGSTTASIAW